jgi:general secretion pathway protein H
MLVVVAVLALVLVLLVQHGPQHSRTLDARAAAATLAQALRAARARAIETDRSVAVTLDLAAHRMRAGDARPTALPDLPITAETIFGPRSENRVAFAFAPDGSASGGRITVGAGPARMRIDIDWLSGRVRVADAR